MAVSLPTMQLCTTILTRPQTSCSVIKADGHVTNGGSQSVSSMHLHVPVQIARLRESEQAEFTLVRLLSRVYAQMFGECRTVRERLLAQPAAVRSLATVCAHMSSDRGRLGEAPVTHLTAERLLATVCAHMCRQVGRLYITPSLDSDVISNTTYSAYA